MPLNAEVLRCDADVQPRLALSDAHIRAYAALLQEGHQLGTIVVFQDGLDYYLADGFHRVAAAKRIGLEELHAEIRTGTKRDARLYACGANKHGKPLSNPDKQRVVLQLLEDAEWGQWSDREIARHCGVGHALVSRLRRSLSTGDSDTAPRMYRTKQGIVTTMETRAIGKRATPDVPGDTDASRGSHPSEVITDTAEMPAGNTVREAVTQAHQGHDMGLTTPPTADAVSDAAERHVTPVVPDDSIPDGHTKETETVHVAFPKRLSRLCDLLEGLATFPNLEQLLLDIPSDCYDRVDQYLEPAFATLNQLKTLWKKHGHEVPEVLVQPSAPQRVRQSTEGKTRRKTKRARTHTAPQAKPRQSAQTAQAATETILSQPALLLAAIRTAPQPLTIEDLRQRPGVDGSRLKRNVERLVEQKKIRETLSGYEVIPT
jgi:hypothetical protein